MKRHEAVILNSAVDLTAKNTKIAEKKKSLRIFAPLRYYGVSGLHYSSPRFCVFCASSRLFQSVLSCCPGSKFGFPAVFGFRVIPTETPSRRNTETPL